MRNNVRFLIQSTFLTFQMLITETITSLCKLKWKKTKQRKTWKVLSVSFLVVWRCTHTRWAAAEGQCVMFLWVLFSSPGQRLRLCLFKSCARLSQAPAVTRRHCLPPAHVIGALVHPSPSLPWFLDSPRSVSVTDGGRPTSTEPLCLTWSLTASRSGCTGWLWWRCEEPISNWRSRWRRSRAERHYYPHKKCAYIR